MDTRKEQIENLQTHLSSIRKIAGWTLQDLGDRVGVTKQTISNLENNKTTMTQTQYIVIRAILDYEIKTNKENEVLAKVVELLLNQKNDYSDKEYQKISKNVEAIAATAAGGIAGATLLNVSAGLLGFPLTAIGVASAGMWLSKILNDKKEEVNNEEKKS